MVHGLAGACFLRCTRASCLHMLLSAPRVQGAHSHVASPGCARSCLRPRGVSSRCAHGVCPRAMRSRVCVIAFVPCAHVLPFVAQHAHCILHVSPNTLPNIRGSYLVLRIVVWTHRPAAGVGSLFLKPVLQPFLGPLLKPFLKPC